MSHLLTSHLFIDMFADSGVFRAGAADDWHPTTEVNKPMPGAYSQPALF
jgi:hypothetical protein